MRKHWKLVECPMAGICSLQRTAEHKEMKRHVLACHPAWAERHNLKKQAYYCYECPRRASFTRKDNYLKHKAKYHQGSA